MGSIFEGYMKKANDALLEEFGEQISYTPKDGEETTVTASVGPEDVTREENEQGGMLLKTRNITVPLTEVSTPGIDDIVTIGTDVWIVTAINNISSGIAELQCRYNQAQSKHHEMHKKRAE